MSAKALKILICILLFTSYSAAQNNKSSYEKLWIRVDVLEKSGRTRSALDIAENIYHKAEKENNQLQMIKALLVKYSLLGAIEENSEIKAVAALKQGVAAARAPYKNILLSILAQAYEQYYDMNRYKILQRSSVKDTSFTDDFTAWDLRRFQMEITSIYLRSLENSKMLFNTPSAEFSEIIEGRYSGSDLSYSTLFDVLASSALEYFMNSEFSVTGPFDEFEIKDAAYLSGAEEFIKIRPAATDTLSSKYHACRIFQILTAYHLRKLRDNNSKKVLAKLDVMRLKYMHENCTRDDKDSILISTLKKSVLSSPSGHVSAVYWLKLAEYYLKFSGDENTSEPINLKSRAFSICDSLLKKNPGRREARELKELRERISERTLSFSVQSEVAAERPFNALFNYKNLDTLYISIIPMSPGNKKLLQRDFKYLPYFYTKLIGVISFSRSLKKEVDFSSHSAEIGLPPLKPGQYILLASDNRNYHQKPGLISHEKFQVTNLAFFVKELNNEISLLVTNRSTGTPEKDVKIEVYKYDIKFETKVIKKDSTLFTDKNGLAFLKNLDSYGNSYELTLTKQGDTLKTKEYFSFSQDLIDRGSEEKNFLFTDRAIYRPGQKLFFKGISLNVNKDDRTSKVISEKPVIVTLFDANKQIQKQIKLKTNEYGSFSGEFDLPSGQLNGLWKISSGLNSDKFFRVEEYKRPQFEIKLDPQKNNISLYDTVIVTGSTVTYSGAPLTNASVSYSVKRSKEYHLWYCYDYEFNKTRIVSGKTLTDSLGHFSLKFTALPAPGENDKSAVFNYSVNVTVVDATGETHEMDLDVRASRQDLFLNSDMPDEVNSEDNKDIKISAFNINNEPSSADVKAIICRLETPAEVFIRRQWDKPDRNASAGSGPDWQMLSEGEKYEDECPDECWNKSDTVFQKQILITGDSIISLKEKKNWKPGRYLLVLSANGKRGKATYEKYFDLFSPSASTIPVNKPLWAVVLTPVVKPGTLVTIAAGTALNEQPVLYEAENKNGILFRKWITLKKGQTILTIPAENNLKDDIVVYLTSFYKNSNYSFSEKILVQKPEKKLNVTFETFRNKILPGSNEQWRLKVKLPNGTPAKAELLAAMYDMSLDAFSTHNWSLNPYPAIRFNGFLWNIDGAFQLTNSENSYDNSENYYGEYFDVSEYDFLKLDLWGFSLYEDYQPGDVLKSRKYQRIRVKHLYPVVSADEEETEEYIPIVEELRNIDPGTKTAEGQVGGVDYSLIEVADAVQARHQVEAKYEQAPPPASLGKYKKKSEITIRKSLQETAFFFPHIPVDQNGEALVSFIAPEALARWKFMAIAHTKDGHYEITEKEVLTQKELMIQANAPRFLREGDTLYFTARISNLTEKLQSGTAVLNLFNALNNEPVDNLFGNILYQDFSLDKKESKAVSWRLTVPYGALRAFTWKVSASTDSSSDGEEGQLPVLTNIQLVTESMPVDVNSFMKKDFTFKKLQDNSSPTLRSHRLTFEFTSNPVWYAIQSLPYLMEYPYECSEQTFSRYFANNVASFLINNNPKIKQVFESWKWLGGDSLKSNLMKNQELKNILLQETPWLMDGQKETSAKQRLGLLFDLAKLAGEKASCEDKLLKTQLPGGGWPWFKGMPASPYITQLIVAGFGHLDKLNIINIKADKNLSEMLKRAIDFCDRQMFNEYMNLIALKEIPATTSTDANIIQYFYARSYFTDIPLKDEYRKAFEFWQKPVYENWLSENKYMQGMIALSANRTGNKSLAKQIVLSLKENSIISDEMGMYFKDNPGWYWYDSPIEMQSLVIEAFNEISQDTASIDLMKKWLLKRKQATCWATTRATAGACYALLLRGTDWINEEKIPTLVIGNQKLDIQSDAAEAGTGYIKTSWEGNKITPEMAKLHIENNNNAPASGAVYWQYFELLDKIAPGSTQLSLKKQVFLETEDVYGKKLVPISENTSLKPGDMLKVRVELRADRDMEYIHMKDMRASGFEPVNVLSTYKYQDGLWYYESTKDAATNFFIEYLRKGTYIFEYPLRATYKGAFSNGITTIQCMYAPEFSSHSEGIRMKVE